MFTYLNPLVDIWLLVVRFFVGLSMETMSELSSNSSSPAYAVEIRNLVKTYRSSFKRQTFRAVDDVSLSIAAGEVYGLIGPNGSGKSTTMKVMLGIVRPTEGECSIFGISSDRSGSRRLVGYLPENPYFYKHLTGAETLKFYGELCGLRGKSLRAKVEELLEMVGLENAADRRLGGYSKGMLQRIGLAQAVIHDPQLVVLDEPTAGVDPQGSRQIRDLIMSLKERGITVVLTSHLLEQVQEVCDRIGILSKGRMVREGSLEEMIAVEDQTEGALKRPTEGLLKDIEALVAKHADEGAEIIRVGNPRTTLERLFIEATSETESASGNPKPRK